MVSEFNKIFSQNLLHYLEINNMTQLELSKRLKVSTTAVSEWCLGNKVPRADKIDRLCSIFRCTRSDLVEDHSAAPSDDKVLLSHFHKLNGTGKEKVIDYTADLTGNDKYTKKESSEETAG